MKTTLAATSNSNPSKQHRDCLYRTPEAAAAVNALLGGKLAEARKFASIGPARHRDRAILNRQSHLIRVKRDMASKTFLTALVCGLALLFAVTAQDTAGVIGWYHGDWQSGIPSAPNWYNGPNEFARVYDQFQVPAGGWTVTGVFVNSMIGGFPGVAQVSWEIRRGMAPGQGGELVAGGMSVATTSADPAVTSNKYPANVARQHFRIAANYLHVSLAPGSYWVSVAPAGKGQAFANPTLGLNAIGLDTNGIKMALVDSSSGPHFAIAESIGRTGQVGRAKAFSQGVTISR